MRNTEMCAYGCRGVGFCEMASINWNNFDLSLLIVFDVAIAEQNLTRVGRSLGISPMSKCGDSVALADRT
jgi:hypothetical protein